MYCVRVFVWHTRRPCKISYETRTALARAVVDVVLVARHGADDLVERGDDGDDAGRCRSDARARTRAALAAAERLRVTVDAAGADIARGGFPKYAFFSHQNESRPVISTPTATRQDLNRLLRYSQADTFSSSPPHFPVNVKGRVMSRGPGILLSLRHTHNRTPTD